MQPFDQSGDGDGQQKPRDEHGIGADPGHHGEHGAQREQNTLLGQHAHGTSRIVIRFNTSLAVEGTPRTCRSWWIIRVAAP